MWGQRRGWQSSANACSPLSRAEHCGDKSCCHQHNNTSWLCCLLAKLPELVSSSVLIVPAPFILIKKEVSIQTDTSLP